MVILVGALLFGRPDVGLELVALWTIVSLIFHAVRLAQANGAPDRGRHRSLLADVSLDRARPGRVAAGRATRSRRAMAPT